MKTKKRKRGVLLKTGITRDVPLASFVSGTSFADISKRYKRTPERIWQIIRSGCSKIEFDQYHEQHRINRKANRLKRFLACAEEMRRIPSRKQALAVLPAFQIHCAEFRKTAEEKGYVYIKQEYKKGRPRKYTVEELLSYLKKLAVELGHTPSCGEIRRERRFSHNMYISCFGSLRKAQKMAGLTPNEMHNSLENARRHKRYTTKEQCLEDIKRLHIELGCPPTIEQLKEHGKYSLSKYYNRLGGLKKMKNLPGISFDAH